MDEKMTDQETLLYCLDRINPALLEYDEWLVVGCALKNAGCTPEQWDLWSRRDPGRYHEGECARKWRTFHGAYGRDAGVGSVVKMLRDQGGTLPGNREDTGRAFGWDDLIPGEDVVVVKSGWIQEKKLPDPPRVWNPVSDFQTYVATLFHPDEYVGYVTDARREDSGRWSPRKGAWTRTAGELIELCRNETDLSRIIGDWEESCGAWIRFNPLDGKGVTDGNVAAYRYALVESDSISVDQQYSIARQLELPVAAMVHSGGKSLHLIVRIDAPDFKEYQKRVDFLYEVCRRNGMVIDRKNRNPSRLSRLPGATRNGAPQYLAAVNIGKASWREWTEWIAALNDDLPDFENAAAWLEHPPELAECLIDGILRKGHKMLLSGPSKAGKSFLLLELCVAIAEGTRWLGWNCRQGRVLYVNLELDRASCYHRIRDVYRALELTPRHADRIDLWHLRGKAMGLDQLAPRLIRRAARCNYAAIVIDPIYKVITGDENAADQMAKFCNQFDKVCAELGASVIYCHHHSKGEQYQKRAQDRASGSGVFARDPDALIDMIELEIDDERRTAVVNHFGCAALKKILDRECPSWHERIGIGNEYRLAALVDGAVRLLGQERILPAVEAAEAAAERASGWRVSGILREFPAFRPRNVFFCYPSHPVDQAGLLTDAAAPGAGRSRTAAGTQKSRKDIKLGQTLLALEEMKKNNRSTVQDFQHLIQVKTESTAIRRLEEAGVTCRNGVILWEK